jgi:hypothetical protein
MKTDFLKDSLGWKDDWVKSSFECFVSASSSYKNSVTPSTIPSVFDAGNIASGV